MYFTDPYLLLLGYLIYIRASNVTASILPGKGKIRKTNSSSKKNLINLVK
jgi:hypothetical protein